MQKNTPFSLIDTHAHLDLLESPVDEVNEAKASGVSQVIGVSMGKTSADTILCLAESMPDTILPALGLHPWNIDKEDIEQSLTYIENHLHRAVAVGEIGLDYKLQTPKKLQKEVFSKQLSMAQARNLPVLLHCRYSHRRVLDLVLEAGLQRAVFHWYSGPSDVLQDIVTAGYFISATPAVKYSPRHQEAVRTVPLGNLLLETDCPVAYDGLVASPGDVVDLCKRVASLRTITFEELAATTTQNARQLFGLQSEFSPGISV